MTHSRLEISPVTTRPQRGDIMTDHLSQLLYAARWLGMLLVLGVHATAAFINLNEASPHTLPLAATIWRSVISYPFGRQAVIGFFVMSGFLVGGQVLARRRDAKPFLRDYYIHRIVRIYMVVIPAIALTFAFDTIGRNIFPANSGGYPLFEGHYDPRYILTNLLNLQGIVATHYGTNGPLWSVAYEFWYYMVFPLLLAPMIVSFDPNRARLCASITMLFCIAITFRQIWFPFGLLIWTVGAIISRLKKPIVQSPGVACAQFVSIGLILGLSLSISAVHNHPWLQYISDMTTALAFANLILTLRFVDRLNWKWLGWRGHKVLADFSFTLYAIHNPTLLLSRAMITAVLGPTWSDGVAAPLQWVAMAVAMSLTIFLAYALSIFTEGEVGAARRLVKAALLRFWPEAGDGRSASG